MDKWIIDFDGSRSEPTRLYFSIRYDKRVATADYEEILKLGAYRFNRVEHTFEQSTKYLEDWTLDAEEFDFQVESFLGRLKINGGIEEMWLGAGNDGIKSMTSFADSVRLEGELHMSVARKYEGRWDADTIEILVDIDELYELEYGMRKAKEGNVGYPSEISIEAWIDEELDSMGRPRIVLEGEIYDFEWGVGTE